MLVHGLMVSFIWLVCGRVLPPADVFALWGERERERERKQKNLKKTHRNRCHNILSVRNEIWTQGLWMQWRQPSWIPSISYILQLTSTGIYGGHKDREKYNKMLKASSPAEKRHFVLSLLIILLLSLLMTLLPLLMTLLLPLKTRGSVISALHVVSSTEVFNPVPSNIISAWTRELSRYPQHVPQTLPWTVVPSSAFASTLRSDWELWLEDKGDDDRDPLGDKAGQDMAAALSILNQAWVPLPAQARDWSCRAVDSPWSDVAVSS